MIEYLKVVGFCCENGQPRKEMFNGCQIILVEVTSPQLDGPCGVHPLHVNEIERYGLGEPKLDDQFIRATKITRLYNSELELKKITE